MDNQENNPNSATNNNTPNNINPNTTNNNISPAPQQQLPPAGISPTQAPQPQPQPQVQPQQQSQISQNIPQPMQQSQPANNVSNQQFPPNPNVINSQNGISQQPVQQPAQVQPNQMTSNSLNNNVNMGTSNSGLNMPSSGIVGGGVDGVNQFNIATPSTTPGPKSKGGSKKLVGIIVSLLLVGVLAGGGAFAYFNFLQVTPEKRLSKAIIQSASTGSLKQKFTATGDFFGGKMNMDIEASNDFNNPSEPKSSMNYTIKIDAGEYSSSAKGEIICVDASTCYSKYTEQNLGSAYSDIDTPAVELNKWVKYDRFSDYSEADAFGFASTINTVLGEVITGKIDGNAKNTIIEEANILEAYKIDSHEDTSIDGKSAVKYSITIGKDKIKSINKAVADQYSLKDNIDDILDGSQDKATIYVDKATNRIVKVDYNEEEGVEGSVQYSDFESKFDIVAP